LVFVLAGNVGQDALVVENLCKSYGSLAAVANLNFGVHHGECFGKKNILEHIFVEIQYMFCFLTGLLGVNGAGVSTIIDKIVFKYIY
jgi:ABC-type uncharacterized transport system ATPase subunit